MCAGDALFDNFGGINVVIFRDHLSGDDVGVRCGRCGADLRGRPGGAADEVSALTAAQFATHAGQYQAVSTAAAQIHSLPVSTLRASALSYAATEAANAAAAG